MNYLMFAMLPWMPLMVMGVPMFWGAVRNV
jgi:hypothetical protein